MYTAFPTLTARDRAENEPGIYVQTDRINYALWHYANSIISMRSPLPLRRRLNGRVAGRLELLLLLLLLLLLFMLLLPLKVDVGVVRLVDVGRPTRLRLRRAALLVKIERPGARHRGVIAETRRRGYDLFG